LRLGGQLSAEPNTVFDQSFVRMSADISDALETSGTGGLVLVCMWIKFVSFTSFVIQPLCLQAAQIATEITLYIDVFTHSSVLKGRVWLLLTLSRQLAAIVECLLSGEPDISQLGSQIPIDEYAS
jgi:hypothetical protein